MSIELYGCMPIFGTIHLFGSGLIFMGLCVLIGSLIAYLACKKMEQTAAQERLSSVYELQSIPKVGTTIKMA
jgi:hypothetical protein